VRRRSSSPEDNDRTNSGMRVTVHNRDLSPTPSISPPLSPYTSSPRRNCTSPSSVSSHQSILRRIGPVVSVRDRLGVRYRKRKICHHCGNDQHGRGSRSERVKKCPAFGHVCRRCQTKNHFENRCKLAKVFDYDEVSSEEEDVREEREYTTIDQIGYNGYDNMDENEDVKLEKVVIKKRSKC